MPRTSVSITEDLRKRMDTVTEPINWSQVATAAFEAKLAEIAARKKERTMHDVVQRLRASRIESEDSESTKGREAGADWAMNYADWRMLSRLVRAAKERGFEPRTGVPAAIAVVELAFSDSELAELDDADRARLLVEFFGDEHDVSLEFARGFVNGAADIYDLVAPQVES